MTDHIAMMIWLIGILPAIVINMLVVSIWSDHDGKWDDEEARREWVRGGAPFVLLAALFWPCALGTGAVLLAFNWGFVLPIKWLLGWIDSRLHPKDPS